MTPEASLSLPTHKENKIPALSNEMDRLLALSILFSCLLVLVRVMLTGRNTYLSLIWNLFLAYVPYFITNCLSQRPQWVARKPLLILLFLAWLVCIPNSFYIITDLFHLADHSVGGLAGDHSGTGLTGKTALPLAGDPQALLWTGDRHAPQWLDLAMILSFAWNGLLLGVLSVRRMEKILRPFLPATHELFFLY